MENIGPGLGGNHQVAARNNLVETTEHFIRGGKGDKDMFSELPSCNNWTEPSSKAKALRGFLVHALTLKKWTWVYQPVSSLRDASWHASPGPRRHVGMRFIQISCARLLSCCHEKQTIISFLCPRPSPRFYATWIHGSFFYFSQSNQFYFHCFLADQSVYHELPCFKWK